MIMMMTTMSTKHSSPASVSRPLQTATPSQRNSSVATFQTFSRRYHTVTCVLELCAAQVDSESNNSSLGRASRTERSGADSGGWSDEEEARHRPTEPTGDATTHTAAHDAVHDSLVISRRYRATISHTRRRSVVVVDVAKSLQSQRIRDRLAAAFDAALDTVRQICRVPDFDESTE